MNIPRLIPHFRLNVINPTFGQKAPEASDSIPETELAIVPNWGPAFWRHSKESYYSCAPPQDLFSSSQKS